MASNVPKLPASLEDIPEECIREIMFSVPVTERTHFRRVCKKWCRAIDDCWRSIKNLEIVKPSTPEEKPCVTGDCDTIRIVTPQCNLAEEYLKRHFAEVKNRDYWRCFYPSEEDQKLSVPAQKMHKGILRRCYFLKKLTSHFVDEEFIVLIGQKIHLEELSLEFNVCWKAEIYSSDPILKSILNLKDLKKLSIVGPKTKYRNRYIRIPIPVPSCFPDMISANLHKLESLTLGPSWVLEDICFHDFEALKELRVDGCSMIELFTFFHRFRGLEVLSITDCRISVEYVIIVLHHTKVLDSLYIDDTPVTDDELMSAISRTKTSMFCRPKFYFIVSETPSRMKITWTYLNP